MSDPAVAAQRQQARQQGLIVGLITLPLRFAGVLCGSLLLAVVIECIGMHLLWPEQGWRHARGMLTYELDQLSAHFTRSVLIREPARTAYGLVRTVYDQLNRSGIVDRARKTSAAARDEARHTTRGIKYLLSRVYAHVEAYALVASYTLLTFLVRVMVLGLTLPLFVMAAFAGFIDGLVRRDLRRFGAGRESGFLYHRAKASILPLAVLPWVAYLALPVSVHPLLILMPSAILLSVAVNIAAASFKKYL